MLKENLAILDQLTFLCNKSCKFCFFDYADSISNNYIFNGLNPKEVCHLIKSTEYKIKTWGKDEIIMHNGDNLKHLYMLVKGIAICEIMSFSGKVLRVDELIAADIIGSNFLFGKDSEIPYDVVAKEFVRAIVIRKEVFLKLFLKDERILTNYLNSINNWSRKQSKRLKLLGLNTLKGKVAFYLLECAKNKNCTSYRIDNTQCELAEMFGVARQSITRVIKSLDESNIIESKGKKISIIDKKALQSLLK